MRRWARRLGVGLLALAAAAVAVLVALVGPYVRDDWRLDGVVQAVALDWRDFGLDEARTRLQYELDHQRIGRQVGDDACAFREDPDRRLVRCAWSVDVPVPGTDARIPLSFESRAAVLADGDLR